MTGLLAALVESSNDAILIRNLDGQITFWSKAAERLFGFRSDELLGRSGTMLAPPELADANADLLDRVIQGESFDQLETLRFRKDGRRLDVSITLSPIRDSSGQIVGASEIIRDITHAKTAERQLRRRNEELNTFLETAQIGLHRVGPDGTVLWANAAEMEMLGYTPEEYIGHHIAEFHADETAINEVLGTLGGGGKLYEYEARLKCKDGSIKHVLIDSSVLWENGRFVHTQCFTRDITRRKELEQSLHANQQLLRGIIDNSQAVIYVKDFEGRYLLANLRYPDIFHVSTDWILGKTDYDFMPRDKAEAIRAVDQRVAQADQPLVLEEVVPHDDGPHTYLSVKCPLRDENGKSYAVFGISTDITDRKRAEEELRKAHGALKEHADELQAIADAVPGIIAFAGRDLRYQFCNRTFEQWVGKPRSEIMGRHVQETVKPHLWEQLKPRLEQALEGKTVSFELERGDSEAIRWAQVVYTPRYSEEGRNIGVITFASDITARKQAEEALKESEERFRAVVDNIAQLAWMADAQGFIFWYNQRWLEYTGATMEEMKGWGWTRVHHPEHVERVVRRIQHSWQTGEPWEDTFPLRRRDGVYRWFLSRALPIHDANGNVLRWFGTNTDVTEQRETAMELLRTKNELERLNSDLEKEAARRALRLQETIGELESFSYAIVHDMRAPLRALQGFAQILLDDYSSAVDEDGKVYLRKLGQSAERMDGMVRDVLNYSNTLRGNLPVEKVDAGAILKGVLENYPQFSKDRLDVVIDGELPAVQANPAALGQCFSNLLDNAAKFVAPGVKPRVKISARKEAGDVHIRFEDNGIGVPHEQQEKIFNLFYQLDKARGGSGVGLAVVRKAVQRMGGRVGVEPGASGGSCFWIDLKGADA